MVLLAAVCGSLCVAIQLTKDHMEVGEQVDRIEKIRHGIFRPCIISVALYNVINK